MGMTSETLEFEDDKLYHYYPLPQCGEGICKKDLVMTKEIFIECYSRWIMGSEVKMGKIVDTDEVMDIVKSFSLKNDFLEYALPMLFNGVKPVEAIPKADYEARLKAEKVAMLEELQSEIRESDSRAGYAGNGMPTFSTDYIRKKKVNELIQQKINELEGRK